MTRRLIPRYVLRIMVPFSIFPETLDFPQNSLPLVQTLQIPSLALLLRLHNSLSSSAHLFL
jgi:hypothetical protein